MVDLAWWLPAALGGGLFPELATVLLLTGGLAAWVFALAMLCGMAAFEALQRRSAG